ncbi:MAG: M81 family metallopeptidase [Candidatus Ornithospirochaeta sp.]
MRILVGGLHHESDTFNPIVTGKDDIRVLRGEELLSHRAEDAITGIIGTLLENGCEVIPTVLGRAVPNGEWDKECYLSLKREILEAAENEEINGICLALHGSMRVKEIGEAEGDLLSSLRSLLPSIPIVTSLDMHATISKKMMENADAFTGYKTAPHVDERETGQRAASLLLHILRGGKIAMGGVKLPFLVAGEKSETSVEPMKGIMEKVKEMEEEEGILSASILMGFPWADTEDAGVTALIVTDGDKETAEKKAEELASLFWERRDEFVFYNETRLPEEAPERILDLIEGGLVPVVVSDSGDNPTAGSSQDNTEFLSLLLSDKRISALDPPLVYQGFYDPQFLEKCFEKGEGGTVEGKLGAFFDTKKSSPLHVEAKVKATKRNWGKAYPTDLALVEIGGIDVVVTSAHVGCYDPEMMRALGVDVGKRKAVVVKLGYLEPEIRALSSSSFMVLTKGSSDEVLERLPYSRVPRPIWPLDKTGEFRRVMF